MIVFRLDLIFSFPGPSYGDEYYPPYPYYNSYSRPEGADSVFAFRVSVVFYSRTPKNTVTQKIAVIILKLEQFLLTFYYRAMGAKDADGMANSVDPD